MFLLITLQVLGKSIVMDERITARLKIKKNSVSDTIFCII